MEGSKRKRKSIPVGKSGVCRLSVIVPVFNAENYISRCAASITAQSFSDFELIIVDDGSMDNTRDICLSLAEKDERIKYHALEHGGSYRARLYGAEQAVGEYITFCDADDCYSNSSAFSIIINAFSEYNCTAVQFGYRKKYNHLTRRINSVKKPLLVQGSDFYSHEYPKLLCSTWAESHLTLNIWNKAYHRCLLANLPPSKSADSAFWGDDLVMNLHLLSSNASVLFLPDCLYVYRQSTGGTSSFSMRTMDDLNFIKISQLHFLQHRDDRARLESILFSETASWFFLWVCQAEQRLDDAALTEKIAHILHLPGFIMAHNYYLERSDEDWEAAQLLREANAEQYIINAKRANAEHRRSVKELLYTAMKKAYASI